MTHAFTESTTPRPAAEPQRPGRRGSPASPRWTPGPATAAVLAVAAALLALHAALAWGVRPLWVSVDDDATYVLLGRSLRSFAYRSIYLAGAPRHVQYPPVFPALLAATGALFGERVAAFAAMQTVLSAAALGLAFDSVRRRWSVQLAILLLAACAVNPLLVQRGAALFSETPFMALCMLSLWATARDAPSRAMLFLAGAAALAAAMTRTAGVALLAALLLTWCSERRWRAVLALSAAAAVVLGGWLLWTMLAPHDLLHHSYGTDIARGYGDAATTSSAAPAAAGGATPVGGRTAVPSSAASAAGAIGAALVRMAYRVAEYVTRIIPFWTPLPTVSGTRVDNVAWLALTIGCGGAGAWALWRRWRAAALFLACYGVVLAAWPWTLDRFLSPALPLVLLAMLAGLDLASRRRPGALFGRVVPLVFVATVVATAVVRDGAELRARRECLAADAPGARECLGPKLRSVFDAFDDVRARTNPGDTVLATYGAGFYVRAGRVTLPIRAAIRSPEPSAILGSSKLVVLTLNSVDERARTASMRRLCDRLTPVRTFPPAAVVLRPSPGARAEIADSADTACTTLDRFLADGPRD